MLPLWEESTNWRVLQASAHQDNECSFQFTADVPVWPDQSIFYIEPRPVCVFEYCRKQGLLDSGEECFFSGVVLETVRSFLANWLVSSSRIPDWEPVISTASIELPISESLPENSHIFHWDAIRLLWECQRGLQMKLARRTKLHDNITVEKEIIMLLLLGLPLMNIKEVDVGTSDAATINLDGSGDSGIRYAANFDAENDRDSYYMNPDIPGLKFCFRSTLAPQKVYIVFRVPHTRRVDGEARKMRLNLVDNTEGGRFIWQEWINAAIGYMKGIDEGRAERQAKNKSKERTIRKADLRKPVVELTPLDMYSYSSLPADTESNETGSENGTGTARVSRGCSTVDVSPSIDTVLDIETSENGLENDIERVSTECSTLDVPTRSDTVVDTDKSENGTVKRTARIWTGWPVFDVRICKFEEDQWLAT